MLDVEDWAEIRRLSRAEVMLIKVNLRVMGVLGERSEEGVGGRRPARLWRPARRQAPFSRRTDFPRRQLRRGRVSCDRNRRPSSCSAGCAQAGLRHLSTTVQPHSSKWPRSF